MMKRATWCNAILAWLLAASPAFAQDSFDAQIGEIYARYKLATIVVAVGVGLFLVAGILIRWIQRRQAGSAPSLALGNLSELEKRGLLTREEAVKVRDALIRQATKQPPRSQTRLKGEEALLMDDEVRRLELLAEAKRLEKQARQSATASTQSEEGIPPELQQAVEKGLLSREEALAIAARAKAKGPGTSPSTN